MSVVAAEIGNARIVVTGPGGWIGSAMLAAIARILGSGWDRRVRLFGSHARVLWAPDGVQVAVRALDGIASADLDGALVVHLAYLTKEKAAEHGDQAFIDANRRIDDLVLAALSHARPQALFVASSGAAALAERGEDRHPYGLEKLRQEQRFLAWGAKAKIPVLAGRIFNLAGPYINKIESYAIGSFIAQAERGGRIEVTATVPVFRSYLHVDDLCVLILTALARKTGRDRAIDLCGGEVLEMGEIARAVADMVGGTVGIVRGPVDHAQPNIYLGDPTQTKCLAMELNVELARFAAQLAATRDWMGLVRQ